MRRHTGWSSRNFLSPSKEGVRRRLFQSPRKPSLFAVPSQRKDDPCTSFRKQTMFTTFKRFAFVLILGLHLYFFQVLLQSNATEQRESAQAIGSERTASESPAKLRAATVSPAKKLQPLRPIDLDKYTIRINTWRRPEQLVVSVEHHASCLGVAQIQVVWCDKENEPPKELYNYSNVIIERHEENTLNERFNILSPTPTLGILSIDDDVLRPCEAIDAGFFKWIQSPHRMLGFDARIHVENDDRSWQVSLYHFVFCWGTLSLSHLKMCKTHLIFVLKRRPGSMDT